MIAMPATPLALPIAPNGHPPLPRLTTIYRVLDLVDDPFARDPLAGAFAATSVHEAGRERLLRWIGEDAAAPAAASAAAREGRLAIVTGEPGTGKTRLLAEVTAALASDDAQQVAILPDDDALRTDAQILRGILSALGHAPSGRTGLELMREIGEALGSIRAENRRPGIIIDGADFSGSRLELTRNLLRAGASHGLWIVLFGQPDLRDRVTRRRSLRGLLDLALDLGPLDADDCRTLIEARIAPLRRTPERTLFTGEALEIVATWSGGNAGKLVHLAGECLVEAIARGRDMVDAAVAHLVARELTDQARAQARAETSPGSEPAIQTRIPLFAEDAPASSTTTSGRARRGGRR
jgi:type II secretory pathway predicted ATPase ExeA